MSFAFPNITNVNSSRKEKSRKEIFVDKLKGRTLCKVNPRAPEGLTFTFCNEVTQEMQTVCKLNGLWFVWGTTAQPPMTNVELEEYMTEQLDIIFENGDDSKMLRVMDGSGSLEWE